MTLFPLGTPKRNRLLPWLAVLALSAAACFASVTPERRQQAIDAYARAEKLRAMLEAQPQGKRRKEDYKKVIDTYNEVIRINPAYSKTPLALKDIAELYRQMGRELSSDTYFWNPSKPTDSLRNSIRTTASRATPCSQWRRSTRKTLRIRTRPARLSSTTSPCIPRPTTPMKRGLTLRSLPRQGLPPPQPMRQQH